MFVMLYVTRVVLRTLGAEDFGIYDVVGGAIAMLGFVNTSMASTVQRFLNNAQGKNDDVLQKQVFNIGIAFHLIIAVFMVLVLILMSFFMFNGILNISPNRIDAAKVVYLCLIISTFFTIITVPYDASINAHEDMLTYSIIGIIDIFLKLGVALAIIHTSMDKLILYGILMMFVPIATYLMMGVWCHKKYAECVISIRRYSNRVVAKEMLSYAGWSFVGTSSSIVGNYGNSLVLNHFFGTVLNAVAGIANQFQGMLSVLSAGLMRAINPVIYKMGEVDKKQMITYSYKGCKYSFILLAIFAIPTIIETPLVLKLWLGKVPEWTVIFVRLQLLRCLLEQLTSSFDKSLGAVGKIKELNIYTFVFNLCPIVFLSIAYSLGCPPYWHFIIAILFMVIIVGIIKIYYCKVYCGLRLIEYTIQVINPCLLVSGITFAVELFVWRLLPKETMGRLAIIFILSFITILLMTFLSLSGQERSKVFCLIKSK